MSFICLIPARKNSKRIKNKNLLKIKGKTLVSIAIQEARKSKYILKKNIFVSTDSHEIKKKSEVSGASVPFLRPAHLAQDKTKMHQVLNHFIKTLGKDVSYKYIIVLQPTSPFRTSQHIDQACRYFCKNKNKADKLISVTRLNPDFSPFKIMKEKNFLLRQLDGYKNYHKQKSSYFLRNGPAIFIYKKKMLGSNIYAGNSLMYLMSEEASLDINTFSDLKKIKF